MNAMSPATGTMIPPRMAQSAAPLVPLDRHFNIAVVTLANICWPKGWDVRDKVEEPYPGEGGRAYVDRIRAANKGRFVVWSGASDRTIFGDEEVNWAFRAWHDWCHWNADLGFSPREEATTASVQYDMLMLRYTGHPRLPFWRALLDVEIAGQARHFEATGQFPEDQRAFGENLLWLNYPQFRSLWTPSTFAL